MAITVTFTSTVNVDGASRSAGTTAETGSAGTGGIVIVQEFA